MTERESIVIFGGTSEGRELAEYAACHGIPTLVSVASEYGKSVMAEESCLRVHCGRLDEAQMRDLLMREKPVLVLDATHPHAVEVTRQLAGACKSVGVRYVRIVREAAEQGADAGRDTEMPACCDTGAPDERGIYWVDTVEQAAKLLRLDQEPVLLTTGSKELALFTEKPGLKGRIYARVLPDSGVLALCEQLGISGKHLIAMQGPFSQEMNCALIHMTGAGWLVTKESGGRGGFEEKLAAIEECKIRGIVIRRPKMETGISPEAAKQLLDQMILKQKATKSSRERELSLIGMGMGMGRQLTAEAMEALKNCDALLGAPRMLQDLAAWTKDRRTEPLYLGRDVWKWIQAHPEYRHIAVVYSGDTGFHSGSRGLCELIDAERTAGDPKAGEIKIKVYPGISTAACLCARLKTTWEDLYFASAHGRACDGAALFREHRRVFLLLGSENGLGELCGELTKAGYGDAVVKAGERLGYEEERILTGKAVDFCGVRTDPLTAVILERSDASEMQK